MKLILQRQESQLFSLFLIKCLNIQMLQVLQQIKALFILLAMFLVLCISIIRRVFSISSIFEALAFAKPIRICIRIIGVDTLTLEFLFKTILKEQLSSLLLFLIVLYIWIRIHLIVCICVLLLLVQGRSWLRYWLLEIFDWLLEFWVFLWQLLSLLCRCVFQVLVQISIWLLWWP